MTTVLLTGFEPFAGDHHNPSGEAVSLLASGWEGPEDLVTAVLPVTFAGAATELERLLTAHEPDVVVATGLAGGRAAVSVERVAVNLLDARIPDNAGLQPVDTASIEGGPAALFASLPVKAIVRTVTDAGIPAELSLSAGSFVCNHVFYRAAAWAAASGARAGFLHVPWASGQAPNGEPEMPLEEIARALGLAVRSALDTAVDDAVPGGALH